MFKKFSMGMVAVIMAVAFSAFTAPKNTDTTAVRTMELYWYPVENGVIPQGADLVDHAEKSAVESPCNAGTVNDCLRGFADEQNTSSGPISATGIDQIKTNDQP